MARQRVKTKTTTTRTRRKKYGKGTGFKKCPNCGGDGRVKVRKT